VGTKWAPHSGTLYTFEHVPPERLTFEYLDLARRGAERPAVAGRRQTGAEFYLTLDRRWV